MERIRPFFFVAQLKRLKTMDTNPSAQRSHIPPNGKIVCDSMFISFYFSATKVYIKVSMGSGQTIATSHDLAQLGVAPSQDSSAKLRFRLGSPTKHGVDF